MKNVIGAGAVLFMACINLLYAQDNKLLFTSKPETNTPFEVIISPDAKRFSTAYKESSEGELLFPSSGFYRIEMEAYCLELGDMAPEANTPFTFASIMGKYSEMVTTILANSWKYPDITRDDIQRLIWSLSADITMKDLPDELREIADLLLDEKGKKLLAKNAVLQVAKNLGEKLRDELPAEVEDMLQAQEDIRDLARNTGSSYEEWQAAAVMIAEVTSSKQAYQKELQPWSYLKEDGIYARIFPDGYKKATLEVYVPEYIEVKRDQLGRIISESDAKGNKIETEYDELVKPAEHPSIPGLKAYAFKRIVFSQPDPLKPGHIRRYEISNKGWVFASSGTKRPSSSGKSSLPVTGEHHLITPLFFEDFKARAETAKGYYEEGEKWWNRLKREGRPADYSDVEALMDEKHYQDGLDAASKGMSDKVDWIAEHSLMMRKTWMYSTCVLSGDCDPPGEDEMKGGDKSKDKKLKPFRKGAAPRGAGDSSQQSLGIGRPLKGRG